MTILPACVFPSVEWMAHFVRSESVHIEAHEFYLKKTYRNRYDIMGPNGTQTLSIPIHGSKGSKCPVNEVKIDHGKWQREHWNALTTAYNSSPFFEHYKDDLQPIFENPPEHLMEFFEIGLKTTLKLLGLPDQISYTLNYWEEKTDVDFRNKVKGKRTFDAIQYPQIFEDRFGFVDNLSVLDLLFNSGPEGRIHLNC